MKLLHLDSSIQGDKSASRQISAAIVDQLRVHAANIDVTYRDLAASPPAHLTLDVFGSPQANEILEEFQRSDIVVIGAPLYNFTISSQLKAWIDRILIAGQTFRYTEAGAQGLMGDKRVIVALARGGLYGEGSPYAPFEHAETLLRSALAFIGITQPEFVIAEGLARGDEQRRSAVAAALLEVRQLAAA